MPEPNKQDVFRALVGSGFANLIIEAKPNYHLFQATRVEQLGNEVQYMIAVASERFSTSDVDWLIKDATNRGQSLVLVGEVENVPSTGAVVLTYPQFLARLGGPILSLLPFAPEYPDRLFTLGHNKPVKGLIGKPDDLFEEYVHAGLQFLFGARVIRYGQDRRGEAVPDGLVSVNRSMPLSLYDAKAYSSGYDVDMGGIRQFADYVNGTNRDYAEIVGPVGYFLVISGKFQQDVDDLKEREIEFKSRCHTSLSFLDAKTFGAIVTSLLKEPLLRRTIDWSRIFARHVVTVKDVERQLKARVKDKVLPSANSSV